MNKILVFVFQNGLTDFMNSVGRKLIFIPLRLIYMTEQCFPGQAVEYKTDETDIKTGNIASPNIFLQ